jgi:Asp-tRNA(Asn)/Glu-tRNA(Gln) amidotransferase C subunit
VDSATLNELCGLARLRLDAAEAEAFAAKFDGLLAFVDKIREYEPQSSEPPLTTGEALRLRPDSALRFKWPDGTHHAFRVPRIINFEGEG